LKVSDKTLRLYAVSAQGTTAGEIRAAIDGGATCVQLRAKGLDDHVLAALARDSLPICREAGVPLIVNDSLRAAIASGADGLHVGQSDGDLAHYRAILGPGKILGVSVTNAEQAVIAERFGADYLGSGAVFPTHTKGDADSVSCANLAAITESVSIPVVAIGGIDADNARELAGTGIAGIAVVSALFAPGATAGEIRSRARALRDVADSLFAGGAE
jgi:thiamine-phosphate pyrophosphorylase